MLTAPVLRVPLLGRDPLQAPEAVQALAFSELQVKVELPPGATTVGLAVSVAVGREVTVTTVVAGALLPPAPAHVIENVVLLFNAPELLLPLAARAPSQPPDAVQPLAFVELHVRVLVPPELTVEGTALSLAVGTILTEALALGLVPPAPLQVREKVVAAIRAPVLWLPLLASAPLQPPDALQELALVELHVSVVSSPLFTTVFATLSDAVGTGVVLLLPPPLPPPHDTRVAAARTPKTRVDNRRSPVIVLCIVGHRRSSGLIVCHRRARREEH